LGGRTIAEWQEVMSANEFADWVAYYQLNPFGPFRSDVQAATIASTVANANAAKGKKFRIQDFLPQFRTKATDPAPSTQSLVDFFRGIQAQQKKKK
jgi:hypothetical protein